MTDERDKRPTQLRLETLGEWIGGAKPVREAVAWAREQLGAGVDEAEVRRHVSELMDAAELSGRHTFLPRVSRGFRRASLRRTAHEIVDAFLGAKKGLKVEDGLKAFLKMLGFDAWLEDYIINFAKTGTPGPMFALATGGVFVDDRPGLDGEDATVVYVAANAGSDPKDLARLFLAECAERFPDAARSRYAIDVDAARLYRLSKDKSYREIAQEELGEEFLAQYKDWFREERIEQEAQRIRKKCERFEAYLDSFCGESVPG